MVPAIRIENLGKKYRVVQGKQRAGYRTLRETLVEAASAPLRRLRQGRADDAGEDFWALKDVSFEVHPGEVVGIIGRNGAGKSTLLKILSRITKPTTGRVEINGRVGSLLEVGTGFHPELSGRENVYLNGSILGMSKKEINRHFDAIVAFAEVEKFLDTPVKRYSSGMYVRLAFAVAAHLEPEILIVDEVLAVGDAQFQKKCLGKMGAVAREGRTVLFVSHNLAALQNLCTSGELLVRGELAHSGEIDDVIRNYIGSVDSAHGGEIDLSRHPARGAGSVPLMQHVRLLDHNAQPSETFACGDPITIEIQLMPNAGVEIAHVAVGFNDQFGHRLFTAATYHTPHPWRMTGGELVQCTIDSLPLAPGIFTLTLAAGPEGHSTRDWLQHAIGITIVESDFYGCGNLPNPLHGPVLNKSQWGIVSRRDQ